jgi:peptidoglycan/LPS O-acetylase OafA/YrhL
MRKDISADGLRGLAAVNVLLCHLFLAFLPGGFAFIYPDTTTPDAMRGVVDHIIGFAPLSVLWNGQFAVCIFFVLSGYVLTKAYIERGDAMIFRLRASRRYLRLCVPIFGSVMFAWFVMSMGWSHAREAGALSGSHWIADFWSKPPDLLEALRDGVYGTLLGGWSRFNPTLWTMKIELLGSMFVFAYRSLTLPGRSGVVNFAVAVALLAWFFPHDWPYYTAFLAGSHVGEARLTTSKPWLALALIGAVICGGFDVSPWYDWTHVVPLADNERKALFNVVGGVLLLYVVRCGLLDGVLQSRPAQFMGRVSYAFYLVHLPILLSFSAWFYVMVSKTLALGAVPAALLTIPATFAAVIAAAVVFDRSFDRWGIALSQAVFPAPRTRPKTVAVRSVDGLRRRLRYRRRRVVERGGDVGQRKIKG